MNNKMSVKKKGAIIGLIIGVVGVLMTLLFVPAFGTQSILESGGIFKMITGIFSFVSFIFVYGEVMGCNYIGPDAPADAYCPAEIFSGFIVTIIIFTVVGYLVGMVIDKAKD